MNTFGRKIGIILLLTVSITAVFGFVGINHVQMNCDPDMPNTSCPRGGQTLHAIELYKESMIATVSIGSSLMLALAYLLLSVLVAVISFLLFPSYLKSDHPILFKHRTLDGSYFHKRIIHTWLSLFELSPSFS